MSSHDHECACNRNWGGPCGPCVCEMTLRDLLAAGRSIWADARLTLAEVAVCVTVVVGDLAREARTTAEGDEPDVANVRRELGNLIASAVRWADDLGLDPAACVADALVAQAGYAGRLKGEQA